MVERSFFSTSKMSNPCRHSPSRYSPSRLAVVASLLDWNNNVLLGDTLSSPKPFAQHLGKIIVIKDMRQEFASALMASQSIPCMFRL